MRHGHPGRRRDVSTITTALGAALGRMTVPVFDRLQRVVFAGSALPPDLRARIELLRDRAESPAGLELTCAGISMEPVIHLGQPVLVRAGRPHRGAVAAFVNRRGSIELHRLVLATPLLDWWVHAGDNQVSHDLGLVHGSQLVGIAEVPWARPSPLLTARAAVRLAQAAGRLALSAVRAAADAAWHHGASSGAPTEPGRKPQPRVKAAIAATTCSGPSAISAGWIGRARTAAHAASARGHEPAR